MNDIIELINYLPYDLKILTYKIYLLNNPDFILNIYFRKDLISKKMNIEYACPNLGTYTIKRDYYPLNKLLFQYELFKMKYIDLGENNINNLINWLQKESKFIYDTHSKKTERFFNEKLDYTYDDLCSVNLYNVDLINDGWEYDHQIATIINDNNYFIQNYFQNLKKDNLLILYRF